MSGAVDLRADRGNSAHPDPRVGLASWYTAGHTDGFGDRLLMFDNTGAASLEVLRFHPELATVPDLEARLRERVQRLARFRHPAFPIARAVEHLDDGGGLALVSTHTPGKRLSELLDNPGSRAGLHPAFVTWLVQQVTPALAALQSHGTGLTHGAVCADRLILTPDGHLSLIEHALGTALQHLELTPALLWHDFGLIAPVNDTGDAQLDARTDVIQLAVVALSMLLARRLTLHEVQHRLPTLLDEFTASATARSPFFVPGLRRWLERALQLHPEAYQSAGEALGDLDDLPVHPGAAALEFLQPGDAADTAPSSRTARTRPPARALPSPSVTAPEPVELRALEFAPPPQPAASAEPSAPRRLPEAEPQVVAWPPPVARARRTGAWIAVTLGLIVLAEAAVIALLWTRVPAPGSATVAPAVAVVIESPQPGDTVMVDGREAGTTPLRLHVGADIRSIRVMGSQAQPATIHAGTGASGTADQTSTTGTAALLAQAAARRRSGGMRFTSPIALDVLEGDRVLGSTADGLIVIAAGTHQLELINAALGYRGRHTIIITPGEITTLRITPPTGRLSLNARPWAQVWIDQTAIGETPLANVELPIGRHEVTFRHPQLGERTEAITVRADTVTRVTTTFSR